MMMPWLMFKQLLSGSPTSVEGPLPPDLGEWDPIRQGPYEADSEMHDATVASKAALGARVTVVSAPGGRVQWLPYNDNVITWMKLDGNAEWFFTAQISGCHFYAARVGTETWAFHANLNMNSQNIKQNMKLKDDMCRNVMGNQAYTLTHLLRRDTIMTSDPFRPTMVFGVNLNGWKFYAHAWSTTVFTGMPMAGEKGYDVKNCRIIHPYLDLSCAPGTKLQ